MYISMEYCTAIHKCVCGCGNEVVTPISPTDWQLTFDGKSISLSPSIGNWSFDCQSHYWIVKNKIKYAGKWSDREIQFGRKQDEILKNDFYLDGDKVKEVIIPKDVSKSKLKGRRFKSFLGFFGIK